MEKEQGSGILCRVLDEREEVVVDRERNVCDPILSVCSVSLVENERLVTRRPKFLVTIVFFKR